MPLLSWDGRFDFVSRSLKASYGFFLLHTLSYLKSKSDREKGLLTAVIWTHSACMQLHLIISSCLFITICNHTPVDFTVTLPDRQRRGGKRAPSVSFSVTVICAAFVTLNRSPFSSTRFSFRAASDSAMPAFHLISVLLFHIEGSMSNSLQNGLPFLPCDSLSLRVF